MITIDRIIIMEHHVIHLSQKSNSKVLKIRCYWENLFDKHDSILIAKTFRYYFTYYKTILLS